MSLQTLPAWPLITVISGGQRGADEAGLAAGKWLNYRTGGMAPQEWMTETGPNEELRDVYGLRECAVPGYRPRTYWNVYHSDATVIFHIGELDGGSLYTKQVAEGLKRPVIVNPTPTELRDWIFNTPTKLGAMQILNVAGNRESKSPGIYDKVFGILSQGLIPF